MSLSSSYLLQSWFFNCRRNSLVLKKGDLGVRGYEDVGESWAYPLFTVILVKFPKLLGQFFISNYFIILNKCCMKLICTLLLQSLPKCGSWDSSIWVHVLGKINGSSTDNLITLAMKKKKNFASLKKQVYGFKEDTAQEDTKSNTVQNIPWSWFHQMGKDPQRLGKGIPKRGRTAIRKTRKQL